jgi:CDI toxin RNase A-like protein
MDSAEADAAIRRLPRRLRSSPLVPGGGLQAHEGSGGQRGHTVARHVNKTPAELAQRFKHDPNLKWSSSFTDRATAEAAIAMALAYNRSALRNWLDQSWPTYRFVVDVGADIGRSMARNGTMVSTSKVHVTLRREDTMLGYYIKTAFPTP